jgi:AmmeMemoRadiSam system protein A
MAPSRCIELTPDEKTQLLAMARRSIQHGLTKNQPLEIGHIRLSGPLAQRHANFVTLTQCGILRGCVGTVKATHHLATSIAVHAFRAAFHDSRFSPLSATETDQTRIEISVLSPPEPIDAGTCKELLASLRPYEDGLLLENDGTQATFLPQVWEKAPDPQQFVKYLMTKAGLPDDYWSDSIRFHRYHTISFTEHPVESAVIP